MNTKRWIALSLGAVFLALLFWNRDYIYYKPGPRSDWPFCHDWITLQVNEDTVIRSSECFVVFREGTSLFRAESYPHHSDWESLDDAISFYRDSAFPAEIDERGKICDYDYVRITFQLILGAIDYVYVIDTPGRNVHMEIVGSQIRAKRWFESVKCSPLQP